MFDDGTLVQLPPTDQAYDQNSVENMQGKENVESIQLDSETGTKVDEGLDIDNLLNNKLQEDVKNMETTDTDENKAGIKPLLIKPIVKKPSLIVKPKPTVLSAHLGQSASLIGAKDKKLALTPLHKVPVPKPLSHPKVAESL